MSNETLISVIMASYNHAPYIGQAIESVLAQSYPNWELLIIDDGSTDNSVALITGYTAKDKRIRLFFHDSRSNKGLPETLKLGLAHATGTYTAFLESDDLWQADCLQERLDAIQVTSCHAVFNALELLPMPGARTEWYDSYISSIAAGHSFALTNKSGARLSGGLDLRYALLEENKIPTFSCLMLETELLRGCDHDSPVPRWMDWWLWVQVSHSTCFVYLPKALTIWRLHKTSYNHSINLKNYLKDSCLVWKGFRRLACSSEKKMPLAYKIILLLPFWCRMLRRFFLIIQRAGISGGVEAIKRRLQS
jgi:glycosyltransferase involved in cell wall biosynthesis